PPPPPNAPTKSRRCSSAPWPASGSMSSWKCFAATAPTTNFNAASKSPPPVSFPTSPDPPRKAEGAAQGADVGLDTEKVGGGRGPAAFQEGFGDPLDKLTRVGGNDV